MGDINKRHRLVNPMLPKPKHCFYGSKAIAREKAFKPTVCLCASITDSTEEKLRAYNAKRVSLFTEKVVQLLKSVGKYNVKRRYKPTWPSYLLDTPIINTLNYLDEMSITKCYDNSVSLMPSPLHSIELSDQEHYNKFRSQVRPRGCSKTFNGQIFRYSDQSKEREGNEYLPNDQKKQCTDQLEKSGLEKANEIKTTNEVLKGIGNKVTSRGHELSSHIQVDFASLSGTKGKFSQKNIKDCLCEERVYSDKIKKLPKKTVLNKQGTTYEYPITIPIGKKLEVFTLNNRDGNGRRQRSIWIRIDNIPEDIEMIKIKSDMTNVLPQKYNEFSKQSLNKTMMQNCSSIKKLGNQIVRMADESVQAYSICNSNSHPRRRIWDNLPKDKTEILERVLAFKETIKEFRESKERLEKHINLRSGRKRF